MTEREPRRRDVGRHAVQLRAEPHAAAVVRDAGRRGFSDIAAKAGADVILSNHTELRRQQDEAAGGAGTEAGRAASVRRRHAMACSAI